MSYLELEQALNALSTGSVLEGPFKDKAPNLKDIFEKYRYRPKKLARELAKTIVNVVKTKKKPSFLTIEEYAELIGRHPWTVRKQCREGKIPTARKIGTTWVIE